MSMTESGAAMFHAVAHLMSNLFLFFLVFGMSATVDTDELWLQLKNKRAIGTGVMMQFFIMPFLGFVAVESLGAALSPAVGIILLVVTSSPGGSYSNWFCSVFNADLALSVAMTSISTLLSVFLLPANLLLYSYLAFGQSTEQSVLHNVNWGTLLVSLLIVIVAIVTGLYASYRVKSQSWSSTFRAWSNRCGSVSGIVLVVFSALISSFAEEGEDGESSKVWERDWQFYAGVAFPCLAGLVLANVFSYYGFKDPERVTLSIECCYQNCGIATSVAMTMFTNGQERADAMGVPLFYGLVEAVVLAAYCIFAWKRGWTKAPKNEKLCVMLTTTYEVKGDNYAIGSRKNIFAPTEVEILK